MKGITALLGAIVLLAVAELGVWLLSAMWLMLAVGDMHRNWWPAIPAMGYGAALPVAFCLDGFLALVVVSSAATVGRRKS